MSVRVKRYSSVGTNEPGPGIDNSFNQAETTVDGYTFHWGHNETRNFLDDSVGQRHAAFNPGTNVAEDAIPFGSSRA